VRGAMLWFFFCGRGSNRAARLFYCVALFISADRPTAYSIPVRALGGGRHMYLARLSVPSLVIRFTAGQAGRNIAYGMRHALTDLVSGGASIYQDSVRTKRANSGAPLRTKQETLSKPGVEEMRGRPVFDKKNLPELGKHLAHHFCRSGAA